MMKSLISTASVFFATIATTLAVSTTPTTVTNVLQNVTLQLTIYQQGAVAANGKKVADKVTAFSTKNFIQAVAAVAGTNFGASPKLVLSSVYTNIVVTNSPGTFSNSFSTNLPVSPTALNGLNIGTSYFVGTNVVTITGNQLSYGPPAESINTNVIAIATNTSEFVTISTNATSLVTITPQTNGAGLVTNNLVVEQTQTAPPSTETTLTNVSRSVAILSGGTANNLYPVTNFISFSTNSPEIVVQTGVNLSADPLTVANLASQSGFSIQGLNIAYFVTNTASNLVLNLQGFVKQALKVDVLSAHGTNRTVEDIFGASATWNALGSGYVGGAVISNSTSIPAGTVDGSTIYGFLTNASPVVVQGSVNISFLKNLAQ